MTADVPVPPDPSGTSYPESVLHVDGRWLREATGGSLDVHDPATGEVVARPAAASPVEARAAADAAAHAFRAWSALTAWDRFQLIGRATALLRGRADRIARTLTLEQGKPLAEATREVVLAADIIDFLAEEAKRLAIRGVPPRVPSIASQTVERVPVGPVAALTPWNFPANLPARKLGGALAAGCTLVIKPAEQTPGTCAELVRAFEDAGVPPGVINVVTGAPAPLAEALIAHPGIEKVSFTGSVPVGRQLGERVGRLQKRYTAELGGHAAVVVTADVDVDQVAAACVQAKFRNAGQVCTAPVRFLVDARVYARFRDAFVERARALRVGPGFDPASQMGPLTHLRRVAEMETMTADALSRGGRRLCGGERLDRPGYFYAPTVLEAVPHGARVQCEEPFGPIALLEAWDDLDAAIANANRLRYGLAAYGFTDDLRIAQRLARELAAGMVAINHFGVSQPETPFGGVRDSGSGHESGLEGLLAYTDLKLVSFAS